MANAANKGGIIANKPLHTAAKKKDRETKPLCLSAKAI